MFRQTLAQIKLLSNNSPDALRAERAMYNLVCCNVKLCKKVLTLLSCWTLSEILVGKVRYTYIVNAMAADWLMFYRKNIKHKI